MSATDNPAWCKPGHQRAGLVTNQDPDQPYNKDEPHGMVSVCERPECIAKAIKYVAGNTNRQTDFYSDAERRAQRAETP